MKRIIKDPNAVLDYQFGWTEWLDGDTIASYQIIADAGITVVAETDLAGVVTAWLSGGAAGKSYTVTCRIVTTGGRTDDLSIVLVMRQQ